MTNPRLNLDRFRMDLGLISDQQAETLHLIDARTKRPIVRALSLIALQLTQSLNARFYRIIYTHDLRDSRYLDWTTVAWCTDVAASAQADE